MYDIIYYFLYLLILSVNFLIIFYNFTYNKITKGTIFYLLINTLIDLIIVAIGKEFLLLPISTVILTCFSFMNLRKISYSIFIVILTDLVFAVSDSITAFLAITFFHVNFNSISKRSLEYFVIAIIITSISFIISRLLGKILNKVNIHNYEISKNLRNRLAVFFYAGFVLIIVNINIFDYKYFAKNLDNFVVNLNAFNTVSDFIIVIILLYLNNRIIKNKLLQEYKDKELKHLKEYTDMIETMSDDLRRFKHDYANIFQVLGSYIESNDMKGVKTFYKNELQPESEKIINKNRSLYLLKNIKINSLKGLISSKIYSANSNNINTYIEIYDDIHELSINEIDICRIIGILLDNAIEAAVLCDKKVIRLAIIKKENYTSFIISNICHENTPPIHKIYEDGFSTKGYGRGVGLKIVRKIIKEKYANVFLHTKVKDCVFKQDLVIKDLN
ncbi:histidine kinase [Clostridium pasteurianum BC1]|uniref:Histidine kinase n=2 Tax=Clostridium pasteurianum TaxID=1501 RepID=R4K0E7_CLOPA|nr:histidine kinase [Clostridium pasteurianum BC1]